MARGSLDLVSNRPAWIIGLTGVTLLLGGVVFALRRQGGLGGRHIRGRARQAPVVNQTKSGGMLTTLRAADSMSIEQRVASIQDMVEKSIQDPQMRKLAIQVTSRCPERDGRCEAEAIYMFVKKNVRYTGDIAPIRWSDGRVEGVDLFPAARRTLEFGGDDCDGHSIVTATLLALNGITPRLRVVKTRGAADWEHIYTGALLPKGTGNKFVALDTTLPGSNHFGVEPPYSKHIDFDA